jgi:hypothetical protein
MLFSTDNRKALARPFSSRSRQCRISAIRQNHGTVNLSGRISRKQGLAVCIRNLLPTDAADFGPDLECLAPGSSVLGRSDVIAAEME